MILCNCHTPKWYQLNGIGVEFNSFFSSISIVCRYDYVLLQNLCTLNCVCTHSKIKSRVSLHKRQSNEICFEEFCQNNMTRDQAVRYKTHYKSDISGISMKPKDIRDPPQLYTLYLIFCVQIFLLRTTIVFLSLRDVSLFVDVFVVVLLFIWLQC